jgi:DNA-binding NarL/FixJ family response regulator
MARTAILVEITATEVATGTTLQHLAASGDAVFHVRRSDASLRRIQYLAPGTKERKTAERIELLRAEGKGMKAIARKLHVSVPTVRRIINSLELSVSVEAGEMNHALELLG